MLVAGVAAAGLMGVGLGLWARPAMSERQVAIAALPKIDPAGPRSLQIVLDDAPAPLGSPIEVLPAAGALPQFVMPTEPPMPQPLAPVRPSAGLVRVQTVEPEPAEAAPPAKPAPRAAPKPEAKVVAKLVEKPKPKLMKVTAPKAKAKPVRAEKVKLVEKAKAQPAKLKVAKAEPKRAAKAQARLAKADGREKPAKVEKASVPKPVAKKTNRLTGFVHAIERGSHKTEAPAKLQKVKLERAKLAKAKAKPVKVAAKAPIKAPIKAPVQKAAVKAKPALKPVRGGGPVRYAKAMPRSDSTVNDADRQMNRAYSSARAAGVPDWQLRRQQARWEQARAAAAREAPWAVHDVYLARIAELHDLTRDAQGPGY